MAEPYNTRRIRIVGGEGTFSPNNSSVLELFPVITIPRETFLDPTKSANKIATIDIFQNQWFSSGTNNYANARMYLVETIDNGQPQMVPTSRITAIYNKGTSVTTANPVSILPVPRNYTSGVTSPRTYVMIDISTLPVGTAVYKLVATWGFY